MMSLPAGAVIRVNPAGAVIRVKMLERSGTGASAMSIVPLHLQRRVEQRWAARVASLVGTIRTKERRIEGLTDQRCAARDTSQSKAREVETPKRRMDLSEC